MSFFSITDTSDYLKELLLHENCGIVHSVYRKTINLSIGGTLAALQAKGSPLSPISLITTLTSEEMEALKIKVGDSFNINGDFITIHKNSESYALSESNRTKKNEITFSLENANIYNLNLTHTLKEKETLLLLYNNIKKSLAGMSTGGFEIIFNHRVNADTSMMLTAAKNRIERCTELYREGKIYETGTELARLIGLGIGLTPSGDDFLCGVLAGLILAGQTDSDLGHSLKNAISQHLTDTVDVSAAFLRCALEGQFSRAVNQLTTLPDKISSNSNSQTDIADAQTITDNFLAIGHSSGTDTLCGIMYALELTLSL